jgi:MOSC domain-containing protein YiiM
MAMVLMPPIELNAVFAGKVALLPGDSRSSAIAKQLLTGRCTVGTEGLVVDEQADRRVHGGIEKALHQFPVEHYARLAAEFPEARHMIPGGLGENLSTASLNEDCVCIGDIFALGTVRLQISQPRTPCWKIDTHCGIEGMTAFIAEYGISGWYYRVLTPGEIGIGDTLVHLERPAGAVSVADLTRTLREQRPSLQCLELMASAPGLNPAWVEKIRGRMDWLARNGDAG